MTDQTFSARLVTQLPIAIVVLDESDKVAQSSDKVGETFGTSMRLYGVTLAEWFLPQDQEAVATALAALRNGAPELIVEAKAEIATGEIRTFELSLSRTPTNDRVVLFRDVTAERAATNEVRSGLMRDSVTGLGSPLLFDERLAHAIVRSKRGAKSPAVVLLRVSAEDGRPAVDSEILRIIAFRLENYLRASDTVAYLRDNTYAVLLEDVSQADEAAEVARRVTDVCAMPITIERGQVSLEVAYGVAHASGSMTAADVLQLARVSLASAQQDAGSESPLNELDEVEDAST